MNVTEIVGIITALGAIVMVLTQLARLLPLPKDEDGKLIVPKFVAFVVASLVVIIPALVDGKLIEANVPALAAAVGAVSVSAYGLYDVSKPMWKALGKLVQAVKDWIAAKRL